MIIRRSRSYTVSQRQAAFWAKVEKGDHWLWTGHCNSVSGHPQFWDGTKVVGAHVYAWELEHGPVPPGQEIRHLCEFPACVLHITVGTRAENVQDMVEQHRCWYHQRPDEILRGDRHGKTKIPDAVIPDLRRRHAGGESLRVLGEELGVTKQAVRYAIRHRGGDAQ